MPIIAKLAYWARQQPDQVAISYGQTSLTYKELFEQLSSGSDQEITNQIQPIHDSCPLRQLLSFLACLKQGTKPLILHPSIPRTSYTNILPTKLSEIPEKADFGVLSSGTEGVAKVFWRAWSSWSQAFCEVERVFKLSRDSRLFCYGSLSFTGNLNLALTQLWLGGTLILCQQPSFLAWTQIWQERKVTHLYLLPSFLKRLLPYVTKISMTGRYLITSSQHMPQEILKTYYHKCLSLSIFIFYGASELSYVTWCDGKEVLATKGLVGQPFSDVNLTLRDGKIYVDSPYMVEGLSLPYSVGDFGEWTEKDLILKGRDQDWVNQYGLKSYLPSLVEKVSQLPQIVDLAAMVVGKDSVEEHLVLCLVLRKNVSLASVKELLKTILSPAERPRRYLLLERLPLNDSGKVDYKYLTQLL
ncbi:AMP-binding protein [Streptococcus ictaluri]|uniref:AMP-binding enzyme domain protein n=1 Tax=Streptococcus ictaluri 707-05 TaxID=764299 RepID=G5K1Z0_9STRE|nr:AMP-binding protein [Streptococcus ictaluri]EHI70174.1 AMP-binding enzyme domain protein [Streptococcus ictaluri 707-05]